MRAGRIVVAGTAAVTLLGLGAACSKNTGNDGGGKSEHKIATGAIATDPAQSEGPAEPIKGAKKGGTVYALEDGDFTHLDPQRVYVSDAEAVDQLLTRTLTMFKTDPKTGKQTLVGDLAVNTGKDVKGDGTVWSYTLKKGIKYEDGSAVTAADVAYGVARSFSPNIADGPHYIAQWLTGNSAYNTDYKGPYNGGKDIPPGVTVKGRTITFHLKGPHPDFPFAASWGITSPLPKAQDKHPQDIDTHPFSCGPYKIKSYKRGDKLVAVRNKYWDPKTDPVRHDYFDKFVTKVGVSAENQTQSIKADNGTEQYAVGINNAPPSMSASLVNDASLKDRLVTGFQPFVQRIDINTQRVTDVNVRKALNYAINKKSYLQVEGGNPQGEVATTIMSPTVSGWHKYDAYPSPGGKGDVAKAKKLLDGKHPKLVFGYANTEIAQKAAVNIKNSLERAGFKITLRSVDKDNYFTLIGRKNNPYDLYKTNWGADWPSGSTVIPPLYDGSALQKEGNTATSYLNVDAVNKKIHEVAKEPAQKAVKDWAKLDEMIMKKYAPSIPLMYMKQISLHGSKLHGVFMAGGFPVFYNAWVG